MCYTSSKNLSTSKIICLDNFQLNFELLEEIPRTCVYPINEEGFGDNLPYISDHYAYALLHLISPVLQIFPISGAPHPSYTPTCLLSN